MRFLNYLKLDEPHNDRKNTSVLWNQFKRQYEELDMNRFHLCGERLWVRAKNV